MIINDSGPGYPSILIVGDSWAKERRLDGGFAALFPGARVVSIGLIGHSTNEIANALVRQPLQGHFDFAVLMVGVNDAVRHLGAKAYVRGVERLAAILPADRIYIVQLPRVAEIGTPLQRARYALHKLIFEDGSDTIESYRKALSRPVIPVDELPLEYKDPAHLTDASFVLLGHHLATHCQRTELMKA